MLSALLLEYLTNVLIKDLRTHPPDDDDVLWNDDLSWLEPYCSGAQDLPDILADMLVPFSIRAYHGCRPADPLGYLARGLEALKPRSYSEALWQLIQKDARFKTCRYRARFDAAVSEMPVKVDEGRVFLAVDDRFFTPPLRTLCHLWERILASDFGTDRSFLCREFQGNRYANDLLC